MSKPSLCFLLSVKVNFLLNWLWIFVSFLIHLKQKKVETPNRIITAQMNIEPAKTVFVQTVFVHFLKH